MNLVIDSGNTLVKVAFFSDNQPSEQFFSSELLSYDQLYAHDCFHAVKKVIVSDVSGRAHEATEKLREKFSLLDMQPGVAVPLDLRGYTTISTLGSDRIAAAVFGRSMFQHNHVLTIQAGTCITYECVTAEGKYDGGAISPGLDMRFRALHNFTAKLPLVKKQEIGFLAGKSTKESLLSGVVNGCVAEIDGIIDQYKKKYPDIKVVLGGGDIFFFDKKLKNRIFAVQNLVLKGLNLILEYNHKW